MFGAPRLHRPCFYFSPHGFDTLMNHWGMESGRSDMNIPASIDIKHPLKVVRMKDREAYERKFKELQAFSC